jgi:hypothetical protein
MHDPWLLPVLAGCFWLPGLLARWAAQLLPGDDDSQHS